MSKHISADQMLQPESQTLAAYVFERLRADLKANRYKPGERLRFDEMRVIYSVGISPLREALSRLTEIGLVTQIGQKGFRVASASWEDLAHIIETRRFLEARALADAIANGDDRWEGDLVAAFHRLSKFSHQKPETENDYAIWEQHHAAFHRALVAGCRSSWLQHVWSAVFDQAERYRRMAITTGHWTDDQIPEHAELLDAALARDSERACTLLRQHIGRSAEQLMPRLDQVLRSAGSDAGSGKRPDKDKTRSKLLHLIQKGEL